MTTLADLLNNHRLRVVPYQENTQTLTKYLGLPFAKYQDYFNKRVALVNTGSDSSAHLLFVRNAQLNKSGLTATSLTGINLVLAPEKVPADLKSSFSRARNTPFVLDKQTLASQVITYEDAEQFLQPTTFAHLSALYIAKEKLTKSELASLICDERTPKIFNLKDFIGVVDNGVLYEYCMQETTRVRLLRHTKANNKFNDEALGLFTKDEQRFLKRAKPLA